MLRPLISLFADDVPLRVALPALAALVLLGAPGAAGAQGMSRVATEVRQIGPAVKLSVPAVAEQDLPLVLNARTLDSRLDLPRV